MVSLRLYGIDKTKDRILSKKEKKMTTQERVEDTFRQYRKKQIAEMRPYIDGEDISRINVGDVSPKVGDFVARDPENHDDQWLVTADFFNRNYEPLTFD